jgi:hypothetical protein
MRFIPTRRWIKESIPAYLCCETSPWTSLWVRFYVWLCPECRKEFSSLKQVWDELDQWEIDLPAENLEDQFTQSFRGKFPSAFQEEREPAPARMGDVILRVAYTSAILVLGAAIFLTQERNPGPSLHQVARVSQPLHSTPLPEITSSKTTNPQSPTMVADSGRTMNKSIRWERSQNLPNRQGSGVLSGDDTTLSRGVQILTTSTSSSPYPTQSRPSLARMKRTVAINYVPITGFETLQAAEEDRSY